MKKIILLSFSLLFLQSCYSTYNSGTPDGVDVYSSQFTWLLNEDPIDVADKHCSQYGKIAVPVKGSVLSVKDSFKCEERK